MAASGECGPSNSVAPASTLQETWDVYFGAQLDDSIELLQEVAARGGVYGDINLGGDRKDNLSNMRVHLHHRYNVLQATVAALWFDKRRGRLRARLSFPKKPCCEAPSVFIGTHRFYDSLAAEFTKFIDPDTGELIGAQLTALSLVTGGMPYSELTSYWRDTLTPPVSMLMPWWEFTNDHYPRSTGHFPLDHSVCGSLIWLVEDVQ